MELIYQAPRSGEPVVVYLPPAKSIAARVLLIGAAAGCPLESLLPADKRLSEDIVVMRQASELIWQSLHSGRSYTAPKATLDIHASGTAKRLLSAWFAYMPGAEITLRQSARLAERPLKPLPQAVEALGGGSIDERNREIRITGRQARGSMFPLELPGNISSQLITALMLPAFSMSLGLKLRILPPIVSAPYIEMTAAVLRRWNVETAFDRATGLLTAHRAVPDMPDAAIIERDWSTASYYYEYTALSGCPVLLKGLTLDSLQGDCRCAAIYQSLGVNSVESREGILLTPGNQRTARLDIDMASTPDLVPAVAVTCAMLRIPFRITGVAHLRIKESDRLAALTGNLQLLGIGATADEDGICSCSAGIPHNPSSPLPVYEDHRIAMAFAMAAVSTGRLGIEHPQCVDKSFPDFFDTLQPLGFRLKSGDKISAVS